MINKIRINNFKSLVGFELELAKLTCLIGLNGAGKSTVLQALDFISQQVSGDINGWLKARQWSKSDLKSQLHKERTIKLDVWVDAGEFGELLWEASFNPTTLRCTYERLLHEGNVVLKVQDSHCQLTWRGVAERESEFIEEFPVVFDYQGSILSQLKEKQLGRAQVAFKNELAAIRSLDMLAPDVLRRKSKKSEGSLGIGGENLAALMHESRAAGRKALSEKLAEVYGGLSGLDTKAKQFGWKELFISERFSNQQTRLPARHVNDGLLRLIAILLQLEVARGLVVFDEVENGINPELIEFLLKQINQAERQVLVTTHSPMILNWLDDEVAKKSVVYLYKNESGHTQSIHFFDIPSQREKLEMLGPGEVFVDTQLSELQGEILRLEGAESQV